MKSEIQNLLKLYLKRINNLKEYECDKSESKLYTIITLNLKSNIIILVF